MSDLKRRRCTIRDVAQAAKVSTSTVSHVINQTRFVAPALAARVQAAMDQLGYRPNRIARSLKRQQTESIGLIVSDISNPFFSTVARGAEDASMEERHTLVICNTDEDREKEQLYLETLLSRQLDGLLIAPNDQRATHLGSLVGPSGTPFVLVDRLVDGLEADAVLTDNVAGAHAAARHLIELGHRRIAIILGRERVSNTQERYDGFRRALVEAEIPLDRTLVQQGRYRLEGGYQATIALLKGGNPPSAIVSTNNLMTIGALEAIRDSNLRCPEDVSLVGFDEGIWSRISEPKLTTVVQDPYEIGYRAVKVLFEHMRGAGHRHPQVIRIPAELKVRASTAPPGAPAGA